MLVLGIVAYVFIFIFGRLKPIADPPATRCVDANLITRGLGERSPGASSCNCRYNRSPKRRANVPTRTQVRSKGAIAVAAQATTENKLKVTAVD